MLKRHLPLVICTLFSYTVLSQTAIEHNQEVKGYWSAAGSPYLVNGLAIVPAGDSLIIEPGVEVRFRPGTEFNYSRANFDAGGLWVKGKLIAQGTAQNRIVFTRQGQEGNWGAIAFEKNADAHSSLEYCRVEYGYSFFNLPQTFGFGAVTVACPGLEISNTQITNNNYRGIYASSATLVVINCIVANNRSTGIEISANFNPNDTSYVINSTIMGNGSYGLYVSSGNSFVQNSIFWGNQFSLTVFSNRPMIVSHSLVQEEVIVDEEIVLGAGMLYGLNPQLDQTYTPASNSPCIDAGGAGPSGPAWPGADIKGQARVINGRIDIGAVEYAGAGYLHLQYPLGQEGWPAGFQQTIKWSGTAGPVRLEYSVDGGGQWQTITASAPETGEFEWTVPVLDSTRCHIRAVSLNQPGVQDESDGPAHLFVSNILDQTRIKGRLFADRTPYHIHGLAIVPYGDSLTVDPGVEIRFRTGEVFDYNNENFDAGGLWIKGKFIARGTAQSRIVFTRLGEEGNWGAVAFEKNADARSVLEYCRVEYANQILNVPNTLGGGAISARHSALSIANSEIIRNAQTGIRSDGARLLLYNSIIAENQSHGVDIDYIYFRDTNFIVNNTIVDNGGIGFQVRSSKTVVQNAVFWNNGQSLAVTNDRCFLSYSLVQEDVLKADWLIVQEGMLYARDPQLAANYVPVANAPVIEAGRNAHAGPPLPASDFNGKPRLVNERVDLGAIEYQGGQYLRLLSPNGREAWRNGTQQTISWDGAAGPVNVEYSADGGQIWQSIATGQPQSGDLDWTVPPLDSTRARVRVSSVSQPQYADESDLDFFIFTSHLPDSAIIRGVLPLQYAPYFVHGLIIVPPNDSLRIEPGVELRFRTGTEFDYAQENFDAGGIWVKGQLNAEGTRDLPIRFTRLQAFGAWGAVAFMESASSNSMLSYCQVEYANFISGLTRTTSGGAVAVSCPTLSIEHSKIMHNNQDGVSGHYSTLKILNTIIAHNLRRGLYLSINQERFGPSQLVNLTVVDNASFGLETYFGRCEIRNSVFWNNQASFRIRNDRTTVYHSLLQERSVAQDWLTMEEGNILGVNPQFVPDDPGLHLKSTSPAIDAGLPGSPYDREPAPNGGVINLGAYGNTPEATTSADIPRIRYLSLAESSMFGYDTLAIAGQGFGAARGSGRLLFGDREALAYLRWSADTVVCVVPPNAPRTVDLALTNNSGGEGRAEGDFSQRAPLLEVISPVQSPLAGNQTITFSGRWFGAGRNGVQVRFGGQPALAYANWSREEITLVCPPHAAGLVDLQFVQSEDIAYTFRESFLYGAENTQELCGALSGRLEGDKIYLLTCPVVIPSGRQLEIEAGAKILSVRTKDQAGPGMTNQGRLLAAGTAEDAILFSSIPQQPGAWKGLILENDASLAYVTVQGGEEGITLRADNILVQNSMIQGNSRNGVLFDGDEYHVDARVLDCSIQDNGEYGVRITAYCYRSSGSVRGAVSGNHIRNNGQGGVEIRSGGSAPSFSSVRATLSATAAPTVFNNVIEDNDGWGVCCQAYGATYAGIPFRINRYANTLPLIRQNIVAGNAAGGLLVEQGSERSAAEISMQNNTFWENGAVGFKTRSGTIAARNELVWGETVQEMINEKGTLDVVYSSTMAALAGEGNLSLDPLFADPASGDFRLQAGSPVIDRGTNAGVDWLLDLDDHIRIWQAVDPDSAVVDMGALEHGSKPAAPPVLLVELVDQTACAGSALQIAPEVESGTPATFQWFKNDAPFSQENALTFANAQETDEGVYYLIVSNAFGRDTSNVFSLQVYPALSGRETIAICLGENYLGWTRAGTYTRNFLSSAGCDSSITTVLSVLPIHDITENIVICQGDEYLGWTESGVYVRHFQSAAGCDSTVTTYLFLEPLPPTPDIMLQGDTLIADRSAVPYQWYLNGTPISGATDQIWIARETGDYSVAAVSAAGCSSPVSEAVAVTVTSVESLSALGVKLYPNPTSDVIVIDAPVHLGVLEIGLYSIHGALIRRERLRRFPGRIDLSEQPPGVYLIVLENLGRAPARVVKQ